MHGLDPPAHIARQGNGEFQPQPVLRAPPGGRRDHVAVGQLDLEDRADPQIVPVAGDAIADFA